MINTGSFLSRKKTTGRLLFKRTAAVDYIDFGNLTLHKQTTNVERTKIMAAQKGYVRTIRERVATLEHRWAFTLDEQLEDAIRLQLFATKAAANQASGSDGDESFVSVVPGNVLKLAKVSVSTVVVEVSAAAKTLGTDYTVDLDSGEITILRTGTIAAGATVDVTYSYAAVTLDAFTSEAEVFVEGTVLIREYDQESGVPRGTYTFAGQIHATDHGDNDGKKVNEFQLEVLATGAITYTRRIDTAS